MKNDLKKYLLLACSLFLLFLAVHYWEHIVRLFSILLSAAWPLILGGIIAYIINILMSWYERKLAPGCKKRLWLSSKRTVCMLLAFLTVVAAFVLLIQLIVPQLTQCFQVLIDALPGAISSFTSWLHNDLNIDVDAFLAQQRFALPSTADEWGTLLQEHASKLINGMGDVMNAVVSATSIVFSAVITFFMSIIFCIYLLTGKEKLRAQCSKLTTRAIGEKPMARLRYIVSVMDECFHAYIVGQLMEALILGGLCVLGMKLLQLPYALMIGALIGVLALIPVAGAYIGAAIGAIMIFSVSPMKAVVFLIFLVILQQIEGNLIYPRTVGSSLHLPGIWVLAAVSIGGSVMGVAGMMIFVPLTASAYRLIGEWANGRRISIPAKNRT